MNRNYSIITDDKDKLVSICYSDKECEYLGSFLSIWVDDDGIPSPFENIEDAETFARIIIKLLRAITKVEE